MHTGQYLTFREKETILIEVAMEDSQAALDQAARDRQCEACLYPHRHRAHTCSRSTGTGIRDTGSALRTKPPGSYDYDEPPEKDGNAAVTTGEHLVFSVHTVILRRAVVAADQRGLGVVVIHPGSYELRVGMAWDRQPKDLDVCFFLLLIKSSLVMDSTAQVVKHVVAKRIMKFDASKGGGKRSEITTPQVGRFEITGMVT